MLKPTALWCRILSFEAPVRTAAVVEVNREATAGGITLKLDRVTDSPGQPEAPRAICKADGPHSIMHRMNAYSEDLRKKIVEALRRGTIKSEAARAFGVSRSSLKRYAKLVEEGRPLAPKKRPGSKPKMDERATKLLEADAEKRTAATLSERREFLEKAAGVLG